MAPMTMANSVAEADAAADAETNAEATSAKGLATISVIGEGETRQVQVLDAAELKRAVPGTSPLKVMGKLPGVNFTSSDPFGAYEWSTRITVRGFNQNQLGFTLDGIPLGDMSYGNHNGLHVSRAAISENVEYVELAQGAGAISTASSSNLGGTAQFFTRDPSLEYAARASQMIGSDNARRTFLSLDTGEHNGLSSYVSGVYSETDKWKGEGPQQQWQFNGKALYQQDVWSLAAYAATSRREETDYADLSLESQQRLGWDWDNYQGDWQRALAAARGNFQGAVNSLDDAYYLGRGLRDDDLASLTMEWDVNDALSTKLVGYYHRNEGQGHWATPYAASSPTIPIALRTTEYDIERTGYMPSLSLSLGAHTIEAGLWTETSVHGLQRNFYLLSGAPDDIFFYRNPAVRVFRQRFDTDTMQYFVTDRIDLMDGLMTVDVGFKGSDVEIDAVSLIGTRASGTIEAKDNFMPQLGLRYGLGDGVELFGSYTENMSAFRPGVSGPFPTTQAAFDTFAADLEPETSDTYEVGVRLTGDAYKASLAAYRVDFQDRLLTIARCAGILGCPSSFANVGDVQSTGIEGTLVLELDEGLQWFNSIAWNEAEYGSDYLNGDTLVPTDGKNVVDAPELLFATELSWSAGPLDASIGAKFTDERFITYLNDSKVDSFWLADASAGYTFEDVGVLESLRVSANVSNLFDEEYFATVGSNGFVTSDPDGLNYTLLTGAPRQFFLNFDARF
ncbi:MAG: TonB-dependent receptor [Ahniella sp.]|nr:TonB-dependent receptor [Ahniella sp.]